MTSKKTDDRLNALARSIGLSLGDATLSEPGTYEYTASHGNPEKRDLTGRWRVESHYVDGIPYAEAYAARRFPDGQPEGLEYESEYEFHAHHCVKRVRVTARLPSGDYEYRLTVALSWRLRGNRLVVQPLIGYQSVSLDGKPAAIQELPGDSAPISIAVERDGERLVLVDGADVKRLCRVLP